MLAGLGLILAAAPGAAHPGHGASAGSGHGGPSTDFSTIRPHARPLERPDFPYVTESGAPRRISAHRGQWVLINFWATWCAPCVEEMPSLAALQAARGGGDFTVLALSEDMDFAARARAFYEAQEISGLAVLGDPEYAAGEALEVEGFPTTVLLDPKGREVFSVYGSYDWASPKARAFLDQVMGEE